jgi:hypothetical protein
LLRKNRTLAINCTRLDFSQSVTSVLTMEQEAQRSGGDNEEGIWQKTEIVDE